VRVNLLVELMATQVSKEPREKRFTKYGLSWPGRQNLLLLEMDMIQQGGQWQDKYGQTIGRGTYYHFREAAKRIWPHIVWHRWLELAVQNYLAHRTIIMIGPASTGKTFAAALCVLLDYYCWSTQTTVIICSTTRQRLEDRIWGEIKNLHKLAKKDHPWLPGNLIEGLQRLVTSPRDEAAEGRDFRNGIVGVAAKKGDVFTGLAEFAGLKNKRMRLVGDELSLLPRAFVDSISNLDKNPDLKVLGLGNPKETTDALGVLGEPAPELGGWEGGIDQTEKTKVWKTRRPDGVCIQFVGTDSPNLDGKLGIPLITQAQIDRDVAFYGKQSLWYTMMDLGMMPRGQGNRRILTRQDCLKHGAFDAPVWLGTQRTKIGFLDAAFGGVGGDRCIFGALEFGNEVPKDLPGAVVNALINQQPANPKDRMVLALLMLLVVPIDVKLDKLPVDQIAEYCKLRCEEQGIGPDFFFFDAGMRSSLVTSFARVWSPLVNAIDCGGKPTERRVSNDIPVLCKDYYSKYITELWYSVRLVVESDQFRGMTDDLCYEFSAREWTVVANNKIEVEPKDKMKDKTGRSPDLADAVAIGVEGARRHGFVIRRVVNQQARRLDDGWRRDLREKASKLWRRPELVQTA
jgi:hypothetical protein